MTVIDKLKQSHLPEPIAIVGAGVTGKSYYDLLTEAGIRCHVFDERDTLPQHFAVNSDKVSLGNFSVDTFADFATILMSPGVDARRDCFAIYSDRIITDIELFGRLVTQPVVGVTGSNGKSSVVSMLYSATKKQGKNYILCGNIGLPVLTALRQSDDSCDGYIVELSSYHLERAPSLRLLVGAWLNVSPDHLDRYDSYQDYVETKAKIFSQSDYCIANAADKRVLRFAQQQSHVTYFSSEEKPPVSVTYYCDDEMIYANQQPIFDMSAFSQVGLHHSENIMAVFAIAKYLKLSETAVVNACLDFKPLPSRSVTVGEKNGVLFINDSKGTNVGATVAAIRGISAPIILIAGGQGKGQDFEPLKKACKQSVKHVFLIGEDAPLLFEMLSAATPTEIVSDLSEAVTKAVTVADAGDVVLLSPACASFDMFENYLARGEAFEKSVKEWIDA